MAIITTSGYERETQARSDRTSAEPAGHDEATATPQQSADVAFAEPGRMLCAGDWTIQAMCKAKTALFFAPPGEREGRRRRREALACAYCAVCPVQDMCRLAGRQGREHGIWGGENDEARAEAGFAPRSPHRRAIAEAARRARDNGVEASIDSDDDVDDTAVPISMTAAVTSAITSG